MRSFFQTLNYEVVFQNFIFLKSFNSKTLIFKFERYSPTDLKINLKKLEVVFQAEDVKIIFQSFIVLKQLLTIIGIVKLTSKQKSKLNGLYLSEPNFTELGTAQHYLIFCFCLCNKYMLLNLSNVFHRVQRRNIWKCKKKLSNHDDVCFGYTISIILQL